MKNSGICPKCNSADIIVFQNRNKRAGIDAGWLGLKAVYLTRYLCGDCGFSEEWVDSPIDISNIREAYQRD